MMTKEILDKVRTLASDILEQCQSKGLTIQEVELLPGELSRQIGTANSKRTESELFLK